MLEEIARRELPIWSASKLPEQENLDLGVLPWRMRLENKLHEWKLHHGIITGLVIFLALWTLGTWFLTRTIVRHNTMSEMKELGYVLPEEQTQEGVQPTFFLTGEDSLNAAIDSAVNAVAPVIAKLNTDDQKLTEAGVMLARVMSSEFPNSFEEVAAQEGQWSLYDGTDRTCEQHDKDLAEKVIRPYMEAQIVPSGLTKKICWTKWTPNDLIGRDDYYESKATVKWRYHG